MADPFLDDLPEDIAAEEAAQGLRDAFNPKKRTGRWADRDVDLELAIQRATSSLPTWDGVAIVEPVKIRHTPAHSFKEGKRLGGKKPKGCQLELDGGKLCRKARVATVHNVPTANEVLTQDWRAYQGARKHWLPWLVDALVESGLPLGLGSVIVEARFCFPDRRKDRDKGNFRGFVEKAIGDALELGGWIKRDNWNTFDFGGVSAQYEKGVRWTELLLMPNTIMDLDDFVAEDPGPPAAEQLGLDVG